MKQYRLHESCGFGALLQSGGESLGSPVSHIEGMIGEQTQALEAHTRIGNQRPFGVRMDGYCNPLQQASFFQGLATAENRVANKRIVLPVEFRRQCLPYGLLFKEAKGPETSVGEKGAVRNVEL